MTTQTMIELQVLFANEEIENYVLLTEHLVYAGASVYQDMIDLREEAERQLGPVKDEQVFYRVFHRDAP